MKDTAALILAAAIVLTSCHGSTITQVGDTQYVKVDHFTDHVEYCEDSQCWDVTKNDKRFSK
jgi:hypothetical protein